MIDRACNNTNDGTIVSVNNNILGIIGTPDATNNIWNCSGSKGHFYYQNNTLYGLDDDIANATMNGPDALADIAPYLTNGTTTYSTNLKLNTIGGDPNFNLLFINAYTTPCDTFSTSISADTVICKGDSVQLLASGGTNYYWLPQAGLSNPNSANPIATPDTTTLYVVRIENTAGCYRTEKVLVKVNPLPKINAISITPSVCGNDDGQITIDAAGNNPLQYSIGNGFKTDNTFLNLSTGNYTLTVLDNNACTYDTTVWVPETNPVAALFSASPPSGTEPLFVNLNNQSLKANHYVWLVENTFLSNAYNSSYTFDSAGVYTVTLIAYNNLPQCADTFSLQIVVYDSLVLQIPNVFTPNNDGMNDTFTIKVEGVKELSVAIFNRWGNLMKEYRSTLNLSPAIINLWDGRSATGEEVPEGVYFYVINVSDIKDEQRKYSGTIHLFK
jgi:gliding motility-associated-like protein